MAWPFDDADLALVVPGSFLELPVLGARAELARAVEHDAIATRLGSPLMAPPARVSVARDAAYTRRITEDSDGVTEVSVAVDDGRVQLPNGTIMDSVSREAYRIMDSRPSAATALCEHALTLARGEWGCHVTTVSTMCSSAGGFVLRNELRVWEHRGGACGCSDRGCNLLDMPTALGAPLFSRVWERTLPRVLC